MPESISFVGLEMVRVYFDRVVNTRESLPGRKSVKMEC